jgi:hypothetical protein
MRLKWRRYWPVAVVAFAAIAVPVIHITVHEYTREPPNYSRIEDGLWLGGRVDKPPPRTRAVLNLCELKDDYVAEVHEWKPICDSSPAPSLDWLREQVAFIEENRAAGRTVYVHCLQGVSRSGMVVVAYYTARNSWSRDEAIAFVRSRRPELRPNPAFLELLSEWERALKN